MQFHFSILLTWLKAVPLLASMLETLHDKGNEQVVAKSKLIALDNGIYWLVIGEKIIWYHKMLVTNIPQE